MLLLKPALSMNPISITSTRLAYQLMGSGEEEDSCHHHHTVFCQRFQSRMGKCWTQRLCPKNAGIAKHGRERRIVQNLLNDGKGISMIVMPTSADLLEQWILKDALKFSEDLSSLTHSCTRSVLEMGIARPRKLL